MTEPLPIFTLEAVAANRPTGGAAFAGLNWTVREGETWAIVGPVGAGKTTLGELLAGRLVVRAGSVEWPLLERLRAAGHPAVYASDLVYRVSFKEDSRLFSYAKHYYQQRFNFVEKDEDLTLDEYLRGGRTTPEGAIQAAADRFGIGQLRELSFLKLSNGQTRRARLARAILAKPELLILDDPFLGVDAAGRDEVAGILGELVRDGHRLVLITRPDAIPDWVTHVLKLDDMAVRWSGTRTNFVVGPASRAGPASRVERECDRPRKPVPLGSRDLPNTTPLIELHDVSVAYNGHPVLDRISWTVRAGERWAVLGPNGSGKTTLLSLLCGDHPQAYANDVRLFGQRRGTGESIWEIKQRVGLLTPELHLYFNEPLTAAQAAATGFDDVVVYRPVTAERRAIVSDFFARFGLTPLLNQPFARLSTGQQRLVLLLRALVKRPPLLILDEPFQGLDRATMLQARDWLDRELLPSQTLLFVTHYADEIPESVTHRLRLDSGRAAAETVGLREQSIPREPT